MNNLNITKIERQKRNENRYNIFINGNFSFALDEVEVLYYKLKENEPISEDKLLQINEEIVYTKARDISYKYLSYKSRTTKELITKLSNDFSDEVIENTIALMEKYNYLNDNKYAEDFIKDKIKLKGFGKNRIKYELKLKGISDSIIQNTVSLYCVDEVDTATKELQKKARGKEILEVKEKKRYIDFLMRKGFSYDVIKLAFENYDNENKK